MTRLAQGRHNGRPTTMRVTGGRPVCKIGALYSDEQKRVARRTVRWPALAFSSSLPFSRNADDDTSPSDRCAEPLGLCAGGTSSTFGPGALGGEGQRYRGPPKRQPVRNYPTTRWSPCPCGPAGIARASWSTGWWRPHRPSPIHVGPALAEQAPGLTLRAPQTRASTRRSTTSTPLGELAG